MPISSAIVSRAVDLVARKLAGVDSEKIVRFTNILSEEAQRISDELQYSGQQVNASILVARLEGFLKRLKYEFRNQGPDPSSYEFPIFNVSHNPNLVCPKPINRLYDKKSKKRNSTPIEQSQAIYSTLKQPINSNLLSYYTYPQQYFLNPSVVYYEAPIATIDKQSTGDDMLSHATIDSELTNSNYQTHVNSQESNSINSEKEKVTTKRIYAAPDTVIGSDTVEDLLQLINSQKSAPSQSTSTTERVIIIDRPGSKSLHKKRSKHKREVSNISASTTSSTTVSASPSSNNTVQQPTLFNVQQPSYQQPTTYMSLPTNAYSTTQSSYSVNMNGYYPIAYYR
ncbi:unnamed protein product [Rotaria magnacalcarata]|uniref:Uncharacterized protein n=3 Tax=Rotaria magnacalcarata TaxID=392030 RepID=A0A815ZDX8_9BILA|nr:unnamed protein product [Rotaria magnacalcarata]CAF1583296.1 unnamed protein product [Rotaria magnacalcarata]CAF3988304.1 unnamed protein product [Rotaria magnacalcarata]